MPISDTEELMKKMDHYLEQRLEKDPTDTLDVAEIIDIANAVTDGLSSSRKFKHKSETFKILERAFKSKFDVSALEMIKVLECESI